MKNTKPTLRHRYKPIPSSSLLDGSCDEKRKSSGGRDEHNSDGFLLITTPTGSFGPIQNENDGRRRGRKKIHRPKDGCRRRQPPYTRWTEIPDETKKLIRQHLGKLMKGYGLTPQVSRGVEPGIYT